MGQVMKDTNRDVQAAASRYLPSICCLCAWQAVGGKCVKVCQSEDGKCGTHRRIAERPGWKSSCEHYEPDCLQIRMEMSRVAQAFAEKVYVLNELMKL